MPRLNIGTEYSIGDVVYLKIRTEEYPGMVTGIQIRHVGENGLGVCYIITWEDGCDGFHYGIELTPVFEQTFKTGFE